MTNTVGMELFPVEQRTWMDAVEPLIARFEVAAKFGADAVHNGTGADAIAQLMRAMAEKLDWAVEHMVPRSSRTDGEERKAIVEWMRSVDWCSESRSYANAFADQIEQGIHHRAKALSDLAEGDGPWI